MNKYKQSFVEVIEGQPRKEHYINVGVAIASIAVVVVLFLTLIFKIFHLGPIKS
ncbi:MAG: hypothetical protein ACXVB0_14120 [Mucilaginibacter sp.]